MRKDYIIIGAGLSGLYAAYRLKQKGYSSIVLEARNRIGGRINTVFSSNDTPVEMGATWFGQQHSNLLALLKELEIEGYEQYMDGLAYFEPFSTAPPQQIQFPKQPASFRIKNGTVSLIHQLAENTEIHLSQIVQKVILTDNEIQVVTETNTYYAGNVISTIPPPLLAETVRFSPELPVNVLNVSKQTHTWMHDSIKFSLIYQRPFWREKGLSGTIFSNVGPITEFYDHCNFEVNKYALCGFVNGSFASLPKEERKEMILNQIERTFGEEGLSFIGFEEVVWANENFTSPTSLRELYPHQNNGNQIFKEALWQNRLILAGTETSSIYGGYMDGAVARINEIINHIK